MTVPTYDQFIEPLLRYLAANENGVTAKQAHEQVANALSLSDQDKQTMLPSGAQLIYKNRAGWAHDRLKRAKLSSSPRRGFWKITPEGMEFIRTRPDPFTPELSEQLAMGYIGVKLRPTAPNGHETNPEPSHLSPQVGPLASPDDRLGQAISELREAAETELLELLANVSLLILRPSCWTCCTAWATAPAALTFNALAAQVMGELMVSFLSIVSDSRRFTSKPSAGKAMLGARTCKRFTVHSLDKRPRRGFSSRLPASPHMPWILQSPWKALFWWMVHA